jgi:hypothetical protein
LRLDLRDEVKVTAVTAFCIVVMLIISNFFDIYMDFISYLVPMIALITYLIITRDKKKKSFFTGPFFWSILVVVISAGVMLYYIFS